MPVLDAFSLPACFLIYDRTVCSSNRLYLSMSIHFYCAQLLPSWLFCCTPVLCKDCSCSLQPSAEREMEVDESDGAWPNKFSWSTQLEKFLAFHVDSRRGLIRHDGSSFKEMDSRHLRGCCAALLTFFSWVWAVRFTDYFSLYLSTAFKILLWGFRDFCWNMSNPIGIFVLCASNLIHICLALTMKSKFKWTLTFRSGFEASKPLVTLERLAASHFWALGRWFVCNHAAQLSGKRGQVANRGRGNSTFLFISFMVKQMVNALRKRLNDQWRTELTWKSVEWLFANEHVMCLYRKMCRKL